MWLEVIYVSAFLLLMFWILLLLVSKWKLRKLKKKYDEKKDLSKIGEEISRGLRKEPTERIGGSEQEEFDIAGFDKPEGRGILPTASSSTVRKDRKSSRGFFGRRRKLRQ